MNYRLLADSWVFWEPNDITLTVEVMEPFGSLEWTAEEPRMKLQVCCNAGTVGLGDTLAVSGTWNNLKIDVFIVKFMLYLCYFGKKHLEILSNVQSTKYFEARHLHTWWYWYHNLFSKISGVLATQVKHVYLVLSALQNAHVDNQNLILEISGGWIKKKKNLFVHANMWKYAYRYPCPEILISKIQKWFEPKTLQFRVFHSSFLLQDKVNPFHADQNPHTSRSVQINKTKGRVTLRKVHHLNDGWNLTGKLISWSLVPLVYKSRKSSIIIVIRDKIRLHPFPMLHFQLLNFFLVWHIYNTIYNLFALVSSATFSIFF